MNNMELELNSCDQPNLNYAFSLQNVHAWTNGHVNKFHAMQCLIWKLLVTRSILQKEGLNLEFWIKSYAMLNFHVHFVIIWP